MTTQPNTITAKQASYIESLVVQVSGRPLDDPINFRKGLATLSKAAASATITGLKDQIRVDSRKTTMDAHIERRDHFRAERKAQAKATVTTIYCDGVATQVTDWEPTYNGQAVPGHSCPDGCCGLMVNFSTWDADTRTADGWIC